jgi:hypothetical protein
LITNRIIVFKYANHQNFQIILSNYPITYRQSFWYIHDSFKLKCFSKSTFRIVSCSVRKAGNLENVTSFHNHLLKHINRVSKLFACNLTQVSWYTNPCLQPSHIFSFSQWFLTLHSSNHFNTFVLHCFSKSTFRIGSCSVRKAGNLENITSLHKQLLKLLIAL